MALASRNRSLVTHTSKCDHAISECSIKCILVKKTLKAHLKIRSVNELQDSQCDSHRSAPLIMPTLVTKGEAKMTELFHGEIFCA